MSDEPKPPTAKYRYTLAISGNSHDEILQELRYEVNGGYLLDSDYETRDEFEVIGGRKTSRLEHTNPTQTPEQYDADLETWWRARKEAKRT